MRKILEILDFIGENENTAFFYTPNIYEDARSYILKNPEVVLEASSKEEVERILVQADTYSEKENLIGVALIPYETGYYFQPKEIKSNIEITGNAPKFMFLFYDKKNVEIFELDELDFAGAENLMNKDVKRDYALNVGKEKYIENIEKIKKYIEKGDCYQVNYTSKLKFNVSREELGAFFLKGIFNQSSRYTAFINAGENYIMSFSPELFFETDYKTVASKPMKGTVKRGSSNADDKRVAEELLNDEKNLAENVMIVDLLRNDVGKISEIDSVKVPKLFEVEKYETLFQLTSTVAGRLKEKSLSGIIKNLFPCGSITGAPKLRTMQIINELETEPRGIYTGAIGLITNTKATFNIAIRTLVVDRKNGRAEFGLGSGIVWDSISENEYEEVLLKGNFISKPVNYFELLETLLLENGEYFLLKNHLERLRNSADFFLFKYDEKKIISELRRKANTLPKDRKFKVRLTLDKWGKVIITTEEIKENLNDVKVLLQKRETLADKRYYRYK
ncbi:MAG: aminodeoxychorismate synthase component I, partial [Chlorobi bacterium]|nr:aminodeoxychorismate synthase component I [Chlorobiota bacterium]